MNNTFKHSGDMGDIIYSLPVIKMLGGGTLYLDITGGEDEPICKAQCIDGKTKFNATNFEFIKPLLEHQSYINKVCVYQKGQQIDYNLNNFRHKFADPNSRSKTKNLLDLHLEAFNLPQWDPNQGWLEIRNKKVLDRQTVVSRSPRMQTNYMWFESNKLKFRDKAVFLGLAKEHEIFEYTFNINIPLYEASNALDAAEVVAGCKALAANSTFALALGIGIGNIPIVQETEFRLPTTMFHGKTNMNYI